MLSWATRPELLENVVSQETRARPHRRSNVSEIAADFAN
jgi:hypothetical protein